MGNCLISLGANLGVPSESISLAANQLRREFGCRSNQFRLSRLYRTPPVGGPSGQPPFVNAVAALETNLDPWACWHIVRKIESDLGRIRQRRWEARKIDLDVLLHDDSRIFTPQLKIPHPRMCMRRFILLPADDVAPDWLDPVSGLTIGQLATSLRTGAGNLTLVAPKTAQATPVLEEAARLAGARWNSSLENDNGNSLDSDDILKTANSTSRWVCLIKPSQLSSPVVRSSKLLVFLAERKTLPGSIAWEDLHLELASQLQLTESRCKQPPRELSCPRYLLAGDDQEWAVHELVSALEAMDCPIEPIQDDSNIAR